MTSINPALMGKGSSSSGGGAAEAASCPDLPAIIVFDLDDCLWTPEMHELSGPPSIPVEGPLDPTDHASELGTVGMKVPSRRRAGGGGFDWGGCNDASEEIVELYPGARRVLRELATNSKYGDVKIAVASTSLEPSYSRACINGIEIVGGVTMKDMISYSQIGRTGNLSSEKTTHFQLIHQESGGVPYQDMLFFGKLAMALQLASVLVVSVTNQSFPSALEDDCNWGDHVGTLHRAYGVTGIRTPQGLSYKDFERGLEHYQKQRR